MDHVSSKQKLEILLKLYYSLLLIIRLKHFKQNHLLLSRVSEEIRRKLGKLGEEEVVELGRSIDVALEVSYTTLTIETS